MGVTWDDIGNAVKKVADWFNGLCSPKVELTGNSVIDYFAGSSNVTKNYTEATGVSIANDGTTGDLTFTVNGMTITVKAGESFNDNFAPFNTLTVTTTVAFRATVRG